MASARSALGLDHELEVGEPDAVHVVVLDVLGPGLAADADQDVGCEDESTK